jgi:hypothetical protein
VRGLVINQAQGPDIEFYGSGGNLIEGDSLGTNAPGTQVFPPNASSGGTLNGIFLKSSTDNTIGGTAPTDRNLISGNGANGIEIPLYLDAGSLFERAFRARPRACRSTRAAPAATVTSTAGTRFSPISGS